MRKLIALFLALSVIFFSHGKAKAVDEWNLTVEVFDLSNEQPIVNMTITIWNNDTGGFATAQTDNTGTVTFPIDIRYGYSVGTPPNDPAYFPDTYTSIQGDAGNQTIGLHLEPTPPPDSGN